MKIEVGKFYRTRDGNKARIYVVDAPGEYSVHGAVDGGIYSWTKYGKYNVDAGDLNIDLVAEWEEPHLRLKAWRSPDGIVRLFDRHINVDGFSSSEIPGYTRAPWLDEPEAK